MTSLSNHKDIHFLNEREQEYGPPLLRSVLYAVVKESLKLLKDKHQKVDVTFTDFITDLLMGTASNNRSDPVMPLDRMSFAKYPERPYYTYIADALYIWRETGQLPKPKGGCQVGVEEIDINFEKFQFKVLQIMDDIADTIQIHALLPVQLACNSSTMKWGFDCFNLFSYESINIQTNRRFLNDNIELNCVQSSRRNSIHRLSSSLSPSSHSSSSPSSLPNVLNVIKVQLHRNILYEFIQLLEYFGSTGLHSLLGMRRTVGTIFICPPSRDLLLHSFSEPFTPFSPSVLTVGARALTKHAPRSSEKFWGVIQGSEISKNILAQDRIEHILDHAVWVNTHVVTGEGNGPVIEIRVSEGYGARWSLILEDKSLQLHEDVNEGGLDEDSRTTRSSSGTGSGRGMEGCEDYDGGGVGRTGDISGKVKVTFRGFLEPYSSDAYAVNWRH